MKQILFFSEFGKAFIPKTFRPRLRKYLLKAGVNKTPFKLYGGFFYISLIITFLIYISQIYPRIEGSGAIKVLLLSFSSWFAIQVIIVMFIILIYYVYIEQKIYQRTQRMEEVIERFLHLVSENLKGGMTLEEAFWNAVRPEFGVLSAEIRHAAKKVMTGSDVAEALKEFMQMYNSPLLTRSFNLIIQGIGGGGNLAGIMDRVVANIVETKKLKREMTATNMTYVIFITFVVLVITPGLFTLSNQFLNILKFFSQEVGSTSLEGAINMPIDFSKMNIDTTAFKQFSLFAISIISSCASMIVSIIRKGAIRAGLRLIPIFVGVSLVVYFLLDKIAGFMVNAFFGF
jgi:pilus assembly protein TadC